LFVRAERKTMAAREERAVRLRDRLRRWWSPAQWADDHPPDASERAGKPTQTQHAWREDAKERPDPQSAFGAQFGGGQIDVGRDLRKR
jgi:hypothetical protein